MGRAFAYSGAIGQRLWGQVAPDYTEYNKEEHTPVHEFVVKLAKIKDRLATETGRRIGRDRHAFMQAFFERLDQEVHGNA